MVCPVQSGDVIALKNNAKALLQKGCAWPRWWTDRRRESLVDKITTW